MVTTNVEHGKKTTAAKQNGTPTAEQPGLPHSILAAMGPGFNAEMLLLE
jgi:predicted naringenin-chalcone synthase